MSIRLLTAADILDFYASGAQYLAVSYGDFTYLNDDDIVQGTPLSYNHVTILQGAARVLFVRTDITDDSWFPNALAGCNLKPAVAAEIAEIVNQDAGLVRDLAVQRAREAATTAEAAAKAAREASTARARAVADVVNMCGGNQSEAAKLLGLDQSRVSRLVAKTAAPGESLEALTVATTKATSALKDMAAKLAE